MNKDTFSDISKEKFELASENDISVSSIDSSSARGFASDAWRRFRKNSASIVASVIIIMIILFALITPLFANKSIGLDSYYAKKGPKVEALSSVFFLDGGQVRTFNEKGLIHAYAIGIGADSGKMIDNIPLQYRTIITPTDKVAASKKGGRFTAEIDTYAEVGFVYMQLTDDEYGDILNWQKENIQVLYPLVADNEYNPDANDANYWYRVDTLSKNTPIDKDGHPVRFSESLDLCDNYLRDESGSLVYSRVVNTSDSGSSYLVRVLYRNYYIYKNGAPVAYPLGTDAQGYDMAQRLASGIRLSLLISLCVFAINFFIGAAYGAVEGYFGGAYDLVLERIADIISCVPFIVVATLFQLHLSDRVGTVISLLFAFVLTGWLPIAARVRSQFYRFKNREYVMSAKTLGASNISIIAKHIFPNALGTLVTSSVLIIPNVILNESMLSFLGIVNLGSSEMTSLGTLLSESASIWTRYPHLMILPALVISLLMICFNLFGNGLRDALNPTLRGSD